MYFDSNDLITLKLTTKLKMLTIHVYRICSRVDRHDDGGNDDTVKENISALSLGQKLKPVVNEQSLYTLYYLK